MREAASPPPEMNRSLLQVISGTDRRGAELFAVDLYEALRERGWDTELYALAPGPRTPPLQVPTFGTRPLGLRTLLALRRRATVDGRLVVAHGSQTLPACAIGLFGSRAPFVYRSIGNPTDWVTTRRRRFRVRRFLRRAIRVAALWAGSAETLTSLLGVPKERISVIGNGRRATDYPPITPDRRAEARRSFGLSDREVVVACIGSLSSEKGVDLAIRAIGRLPDNHRLLIAGDGPERDALEADAAIHASGRVTFAGGTASSHAPLAAADVVLVPSHTEGLSGVAIEAGLSGLPVVITDVGGSAEIVRDGMTGRVVVPNDPKAMAAAVSDCVDHAMAMGTAGRERCLAEFELSVIVDRWEAMLRGLHEETHHAPVRAKAPS